MQFITTFINSLFARAMSARDEAGQTLVEYALIIALVSIAAIIALGLLGGQVSTTFNSIKSTLAGS